MERTTVLPHDDHRLNRAITPETRNDINELAVHALHLSVFRSIIHVCYIRTYVRKKLEGIAREQMNDQKRKEQRKYYLCIDLKSFYASVECADRGLDPFTEKLVVADPDRGPGTICLAASPAIKAAGVPSRCRVFQIPKDIEYTMATPRMGRYMEVAAKINSIYMRHVCPEDMHVYSIDECFIDITPYLGLRKMSAHGFAALLIDEVLKETGITATAGIGSNIFLAKVALDLLAKHEKSGIAELDECSFKQRVWFHQPITDIWGIGPGIARRLSRKGVHDLAGICATDPKWIMREFGKNGEYLIDHAWGQEPCTIKEIRDWQPSSNSLSSGQVLIRNYSAEEARTVVREMATAAALELRKLGKSCEQVALWIGSGYVKTPDGRKSVMHAGGSMKLHERTCSPALITKRILAIYDAKVDKRMSIKRISLSLGALGCARYDQKSLFDDEAREKETSLADTAIAIHERFGKNALLKGGSLKEEATMRERNLQIGGHRA